MNIILAFVVGILSNDSFEDFFFVCGMVVVEGECLIIFSS